MHLLHLPKLGYTMESGAITEWLVPEGKPFEVGDPIYEVETEKNIVQVEARLPGTIAKFVATKDEALDVGSLLAVVADPGESLSAEQVATAVEEDTGTPPDQAEEGADDVGSQLDAPVEGPAALAAPPNGRVRALPKVRAAAERLGVDLATIMGTGPRGSITTEDVEAAAAAASTPASRTVETTAAVRERRTLSGVRLSMARALSASWTQVPQFVQQFRVDVTAVRAYREAKKAAGVSVGFTTVVASAIARAVEEVPEVNASLSGEELTLWADVNLGVAVNSDRGLLVPVVPRVQNLTLTDLEGQLKAVVDAARAGSRTPAETATISLSNLAGYGVETGLPLLTAPQVAIVFTGDVVDTPIALDGQVVIRPMLGVAISFDHRVVDGATGGRFSQALRGALEHPEHLDRQESGQS